MSFSVWGGVSPRGSLSGGRPPPDPVNRMTDARKTLPCPKLRLQAVMTVRFMVSGNQCLITHTRDLLSMQMSLSPTESC